MANSDIATVIWFFSRLYERFPSFWKCCPLSHMQECKRHSAGGLEPSYWNGFHLIMFSSWISEVKGVTRVLSLPMSNPIHPSSEPSGLMDLLWTGWYTAASPKTQLCPEKQPDPDHTGCINALSRDYYPFSGIITFYLPFKLFFLFIFYIILLDRFFFL